MDERILLYVSWRKTFSLAFGPFVIIFLLYFIFSRRKIDEILTWDNWLSPTLVTPFPELSLVCLVGYIVFLTYKLLWLSRERGKYLWLNDGWLMLVTKRLLPVDHLDADRTLIDGWMFPNLVIQSKDNTSHIVNLAFVRFNRNELLSSLRKIKSRNCPPAPKK